MITVSLQPFAFKKIFVLVAALLCLSAAACLADPLFMNVRATPYDRQMSRVTTALLTSSDSTADLSVATVNAWVQELRAIPYAYSAEWRTPEEVEGGAAADCKAKAVALYQRMLAHGAKDVRLVIGKRTAMSCVTHAWLEWNTGSTTLVLDPTINWMASRCDELAEGTYIPLYAYAGARKYCAATAMLLAKQ